MGRELSAHLQAAGFAFEESVLVPDRELGFDGAAAPEVLQAWFDRLSRLAALQQFCGQRFASLRDDLMAALASPEHRTTTSVRCCVARAGRP